MKRLIRSIAFSLAFLLLVALFPLQANAAVSVPANVKSVVFNATYYAAKYSDLKAAFGTDEAKLYNHFLNYGVKEGRQGSPMFSADYYLTKNGDLKAAYGSNRESALSHFISYGINESRVTAAPANLGTGVDMYISMGGTSANLGYNGDNVCIVTPSTNDNQIWTLDRQSDGSYKITNKATGKALDVYAASRASGANVCVYPSNDTNAQRWYIYQNTNNTYTLRAKCGTTCALTVANGKSTAGTNVLMSTFNGGAAQQFVFTEAVNPFADMTPANIGSNFWANIQGVDSGYNLALSGDKALIRYPNLGDNQTWRFIRFSDGSYEITNLKNGKSLHCADGAGTPGTSVITYLSNNSAGQRWYIYDLGGKYLLAPTCSQTCVLTVANGATASGTTVELASCSTSSKAQQFKINNLSATNTQKNLAISEICATPGNGAYEFMELINISNKTVNLSDYSLYRFSVSNSGKYESSSYHSVLGLASPTGADSSVAHMDRINFSDLSVQIASGETTVLWFVSYENKALTVQNFKNYWATQGCDMTGVTVIPVAIYDGSADKFAATNINTGAGKGYLADKKVASAFSLIRNSQLNNRTENGTTLKSLTATADTPLTYDKVALLHNVADCTALHFVSSSTEKGASRNFSSYVDYEAFAAASTEVLADPMQQYTHAYATVPRTSQVTGQIGNDGMPTTVQKYINLNSSGAVNVVTAGVDCGTKQTPTPGTKLPGQFAALNVTGAKGSGANAVTLTGTFQHGKYSQVGFDVAVIRSATGKVITTKTVTTTNISASQTGCTYSCTVSGIPINNDTVVLRVIPFVISHDGIRANGVFKTIRCPLVSATINGKSIEGLKVTYLSSEANAPINDLTGIQEAVELLADDIEYYTGVEVTTDIYNPRADYPQIVIASTGNGAGGNALVANNKTVKSNQYSVVNKTKGEIYVLGGSTIAAEYAAQFIVKALADSTGGTVELTDICFDTPVTLNTAKHTLPITDGADYRILTLNMQIYEYNPDTTRYAKLMEAVNYYAPDVIGFQECCEVNMEKFMPMLKAAGYTVIQQEVHTASGINNRVPLAYKTSRFTCVSKGWEQLPGGDSRFGTTWAVLKNKKTGETFAVTTSHFYNVGHIDDKVIIRQDNTNAVIALTKKIIKKYGCEVINMGDFNMRSFDEAYHLMVDSGILTDSRFVAARDGVLKRIGHELGSSKLSEGAATRTIDYFFVTDQVNILRNRACINMTIACSTDHFPVYADISLNG